MHGRQRIEIMYNHKNVITIFYSGLKAATEWAKVWPDMSKDLLVTCSVFAACDKVEMFSSWFKRFKRLKYLFLIG